MKGARKLTGVKILGTHIFDFRPRKHKNVDSTLLKYTLYPVISLLTRMLGRVGPYEIQLLIETHSYVDAMSARLPPSIIAHTYNFVGSLGGSILYTKILYEVQVTFL